MGFDSVYKLSVVMQMIDNLSQPMKGVTSKVSSSLTSLDGLSQGFGTIAQSGAAMTGLGAQITESVTQPIEATFETKRAIGELASLGVQDLTMLENAATSFSETWAGTNKADFITASYDIKSGIASLTDEGVAKYTELSGITATATKSTIAEMTDLFATGYGIYKGFYNELSDIQFGEMFSAGIAQSVKNFKTTGSGMAEAIKSLGASATTAQVPLEEQLSILGMLQATMSGSEAGTKYQSFLQSAAQGGEELGLNFLDANNQLLSMPEILQMLRGKFGETMDAAEKMELQKAFGDEEAVALIDLLYSKTGELQTNIVSLYGSMATGVGAATQMADAINKTDPNKYEVMKQKIHNMNEEIGNALNPVLGEYIDKAATAVGKASEWISSHQGVVRIFMMLAITIGIALVVVGGATSLIGGLGMMFTRTAAMAGGFVSALRSVPGHLETLYIKALYAKDGLVRVGSSVLTFGKNLVVNGAMAVKNFALSLAAMAKQAIVTAATALPGLISGVWSFTAALLANPITWIVIAIVALIAVIVLLWNKCEWFRNGIKSVFSAISAGVTSGLNAIGSFFSGIRNGIRNVLTAAKDTVKEKLSNMKQAYVEHGGGIKGAAAAAIEGVKGYYTAGFTFLDKLTGGKMTAIKDKFIGGIDKIRENIQKAIGWFRESGKKIMTTFTEGIKSAIGNPAAAVKGGLQSIRNMLPFSDAKIGPLSQLTLSGKKVMTTFAGGIEQEANLPSEAVQKSFEQINFSTAAPKPEIHKGDKTEDGKSERNDKTLDKRTIIEHLHLNVDLKKIEDIKKLLQLLEEIEDYTNGNGSDTEPVPQPV